MRMRARTLAATAATLALGLTLTGVALAGFYDESWWAPPDTPESRLVSHDYYYLRGHLDSGVSQTVCIWRYGESSYCAGNGNVSHTYGSGCGSCYAYFKQKSTVSLNLYGHEEWN
jgi:hypothetical protein